LISLIFSSLGIIDTEGQKEIIILIIVIIIAKITVKHQCINAKIIKNELNYEHNYHVVVRKHQGTVA